MTVLALITDEDAMSAAQAAQQIDMLRRAQDYVRSCDVLDELVDARRKAELIKTWVRLHQAAEALAVEACRLDWLALRKIAAIDPYAIRSTRQRKAARWLADLPQWAFDRYLTEMHHPLSPITAQRDEEREEMRNWGREIGRGDDFDGGRYDPEQIADALLDLLGSAQSEGAMSSTAALRDALKEVLPQCVHQDLVDQGVEQAIRAAFRHQSLPDGYPAWVTWHSRSAGWVHVPWDGATLSQLEWMAKYRRDQASALTKSARELDGLVRIMRVCSARLGGVQRLALLRQAREQAQHDRDTKARERLLADRREARGLSRQPAKPQAKPVRARCTGSAYKGRPCRNPALPGSDRCEYHPDSE